VTGTVPAAELRRSVRRRTCVQVVGFVTQSTRQMPAMARPLMAALAGLLLLVPGAAGAARPHLRAAAGLKASELTSAKGPAVRLRWRDRARGETRWEVRRGLKRTILRAGTTSYTDRRVAAGKTYTYRVRPCRRHRCAAFARVTATVPKTAAGLPPAAGAPPTPAPPGGSPGTPAGTPGGDPFAGSPTVAGCPVFPKDNPWNTDVSAATVDRAKSDAYISSLAGLTLWPDFGSGQYGDYGIPYQTVPGDQPLVPITFHVSPAIAAESDPGPYPIPPGARVEGAAGPGDHHVLVVRRSDCRLFELYDADKQPDNSWSVYSAATFDLRSDALRHDTYTSADAAGLPIFPGLARVDEVQAGAINHALRIAIPHTQNGFIHPATHAASSSSDPALPPMGLRLRLKSSFNVAALHGQARVIAQALQTYGALVADNSGGNKVFISGTPDAGWNDDDLDQLKSIPASAHEAVVTGPVIKG
jgi:hypothetical protein